MESRWQKLLIPAFIELQEQMKRISSPDFSNHAVKSNMYTDKEQGSGATQCEQGKRRCRLFLEDTYKERNEKLRTSRFQCSVPKWVFRVTFSVASGLER